MRSYADYIDIEYLEEYDDEHYARPRKRDKVNGKRKPKPAHIVAQLVESDDAVEHGFNPSFSSSKHERKWIMNYLGPFYADHVITDVLRQVKGGKEATVYCCEAHPSTGVELLAAKVYRPRIFRTLKNDAQYRQGKQVLDQEGREVRGRRESLAMKKKSGFGHDLLHMAWLSNEYQTMRRLYQIGVDVPRTIAQSDNVIPMEYLGDADIAAPTLHHVTLDPAEARPLFERLMRNVALMLAHRVIHGDLSAYNVLYWNGQVKIIDFPQAVDSDVNPDAYELLARDVERLCEYFALYGVETDPGELADELRARFVRLEYGEVGARVDAPAFVRRLRA